MEQLSRLNEQLAVKNRRVAADGADPTNYSDAKQAQTVLYDWFESRGGEVEVLHQSGLPLPERVNRSSP